jgi:hypothetical protein
MLRPLFTIEISHFWPSIAASENAIGKFFSLALTTIVFFEKVLGVERRAVANVPLTGEQRLHGIHK